MVIDVFYYFVPTSATKYVLGWKQLEQGFWTFCTKKFPVDTANSHKKCSMFSHVLVWPHRNCTLLPKIFLIFNTVSIWEWSFLIDQKIVQLHHAVHGTRYFLHRIFSGSCLPQESPMVRQNSECTFNPNPKLRVVEIVGQITVCANNVNNEVY